MRGLVGITLQPGVYQIDVGTVLLDTVGAHPKDGHIRSEHDVLDTGTADDFTDGVVAAISAEVIHQIWFF